MTSAPHRVARLDVLEARSVARVGAALLGLSGVLSLLDLASRPPEAPWGAEVVFVDAVLAMVLSVPTWLLPWSRWRREALLVVALPVLAFIGLGTAADPNATASGVYWLLAAMWIGLAQRRGTMLKMAPVFVAAYLLPLRITGVHSPAALQAMPVVVLGSVLVGETLSYVVARLRRAQDELDAGWHRRLTAMVRESSDVTVLLDADGTIEYVSPSAAAMLGLDGPDLVGRTMASFLARRLHHDDLGAAAAFGAAADASARFTATLEVRLVDGGGRLRHVEARVTNLLDDPDVRAQVVNVRDITDRKALEAQLVHQALHDPLCGLPNRALFEDRLAQAVARAGRTGGRAAVLFCDLDGFKTVNDTLGHGEGDRVLVAVGSRLLAAAGDRATVARFGGDELVVLAEDLDDEAALALGERLVAAVAVPLHVGARRLVVGLSVGVASGDGRTAPAELLSNADAAMYVAKGRGKRCVVQFDQSMRDDASRRLALGSDLWRAVEGGQLVLHYQPTLRIGRDEVVGFEALVRWEHPELGLIPPATFIPVAEESGAIVPIGRWVLDEACREAAAWRRRDPELTVAVNVSARQLHDPDLPGHVAGALAASGLPPAALLLEVTESVLLGDLDSTLARLHDLKALGVRLAVDDFGTGYSSLSYLGRYPFDVLKIDRSFVAGSALRPDAAAVVRAIVELGRNLGLETVAEGVETDGQAMLLAAMGCTFGQGYLWSRPLGAGDAAGLVGQPCRPHSVLPLPAQRPERGSSGSVGSVVHGMQPIDV